MPTDQSAAGAGGKSQELFQRALQVIPGGVNSPVRAFGAVGGVPVFFRRGEGAYLYDEDGRAYIDYVLSWGPLILGHRPAPVIAALEQALAEGTSFGAPTRWEVEFAERITTAVPSVEMVRLVNSGTEATMSALRLARAFTGRDKIIKFAGGYHGHVDSLLVEAGSGVMTFGTPGTPGVTTGTTADTLVLPYNDPQAVTEVFNRHGNQIAAVIVEPVAGNMGCVPPQPGFLQTLRRLTSANGSLLIFDEIITGFRLGFDGAQGLYRITPDLTCFGKIIGAGLPLAAYGGSRQIMSKIAPAGPVYQAGTLSGNPLAVRAGSAMLRELSDGKIYPQLEQYSAQLAQGLTDELSAAGIPHSVQRVGSMLTVFFSDGWVNSYADAQQADTGLYAKFFHGMLQRGIYIPPSQFECWFVSAAHGQRELDQTLAAIRDTLRTI